MFPALTERLHDAIDRGVNYLLSLQASEGYWLGELEADTTLESDYIFYLNVIGKAHPERIAKLANYVRRRQLEDGGWNIYFGGPSELNATVKAYVALRLAGDSPDSEHLRRACRRVHELGGLEASNSYTRLYLALVGAVGWDMVPAVPPELMLLPNWFAINIYEMSSWTRGIVIPLTILYAHKPRFAVPGGISVDALYRDPSRKALASGLGQATLQLAEFLSCAGSWPQAVRARAVEAAAAARAAPGAGMDARASRTHRGIGRDLSGHDECHFCPVGPGAFARRSADRARDRRIFAIRD